MSEVEQIIERCLGSECKQCMEGCEFLRRFCDSPKGFAESFLAGAFNKKPQALFCCTLCDWCETVCPQGINVGHMCIEACQAAVVSGVAPLGGHKLVLKDQEFVRSDQFTLAIPNPEKRNVRRVFFPGCHLSSYRPSLVTSTYEWLRKKDPDTGIILGCCGAPTNGMGFMSEFKEMVAILETEVKEMGAGEIIAACPNCYRTLSLSSEKLNVMLLYDIMASEWDEDDIHTAEGAVFNLHDPCAGRFYTTGHDNVRSLIKLTGAEIEELSHIREDTRCCGVGGMVPYTSPELAQTITKQRAAEATQDLLTYCASCQVALSAQKPTLHILDLIFNPKWREDRGLPPNTPPAKRESQKTLRQTLQDIYRDDL
jgi:Fe-S oxidoreductase